MAYNWDFSKLPEERHKDAIRMAESRDGRGLMLLHNQYMLSPELYCCTIQETFVIKWFQYGIDTGQIKRDSER